MKYYIKELRVSHWIKNLIIFFPLFFGGQLYNFKLGLLSILGFLSFCLLSSAIYVINDIKDIDKDRLHPQKMFRPIAAGKIKNKSAQFFSFTLILLSYLLVIIPCFLHLFSVRVLLILILYLAINLFYSILGYKNIPLIDVILLSSCFLLRLFMGTYLTGITLSSWLYLVVLSGSFYMGFGKRRNELKGNGATTRTVLKKYNTNFLDKNMYSCMTMSIIFFSLWCMEKSTQIKNASYMLLVPLLMMIFFRYSFDIEGDDSKQGDPVTIILKDKWLILLVVLTGMTLLAILYL